jgi:ribosomal protein L24E
VCQLSGTTVSATDAGTCYVDATIAADSSYQGATSADVTVTFTKAAQTVNASANPTSTSWTNTSTVSSSDTSGTGAITYSLDDGENGKTSSAVCQLSGATLSATGPGVCDVYASVATDTNYDAATSSDVAVTFTKASQSITAGATPTSTSWANTSTVSSSGTSGTGTISYTLDEGTNGDTSDPVCQLAGTTVSATGGGICYVYAFIPGDSNYDAAISADVEITFTKLAQSMTASANPTLTSWANTSTVSSSGTSGTGTISYTLDEGGNGHTSDPVCRLSGTTVSATGAGTCYVDASIAADSNYAAATSIDVAVTFTQVAQSITAGANPTSTSWANTSTASSSGSSGTGAVTYALDEGGNGNNSDPVCQLSGTTVSATGAGTCYVDATIAPDANYLGATSPDVVVTFTVAPQSITASASPTSTSWTNTSTVSSSGFAGTGVVTYSIDQGTHGNTSSSVCSIAGTTLSATGPGTCYVYASIAADSNYAAARSADVAVTFTQSRSASPGHGYWLVGSDGGIFSFGSANFYGSTGGMTLNRPVVGISPTADGNGYWLVASDGGVFAFNAPFVGSLPGQGINLYGSGLPHSLNAPIVGMVPAAGGAGYLLVASDGGVFAFNAAFAGSCDSIGGCAGTVVAVVPDASGLGYWLVTSTGDVYAFGDAPYLGAPGLQSTPITSAAATPDRGGYRIMDGSGQVFAYGDAPYFGGLAPGSAEALNPAMAIFADSSQGYWISNAEGKVWIFGDAPFDGDMSGTKLNGAIIAAAGF